MSPDTIAAHLGSSSIPFTSDACRSCSDPCEDGHSEYPSRFDIDMETEMLGSVKPYGSMYIISTNGKEDWTHEITLDSSSLAYSLSPSVASLISSALSGGEGKKGILETAKSTRVSILNSNLHTLDHDSELHTVLVLPEYVFHTSIASSATSLPTSPSPQPIQYDCVILLCSHKKRDARCHIASAILQDTFEAVLNSRGWETSVGGRMEAHDTEDDLDGVDKRALILKVSHTGGHKYAGNVIVCARLNPFVHNANFLLYIDLYQIQDRIMVWESSIASCRIYRGENAGARIGDTRVVEGRCQCHRARWEGAARLVKEAHTDL